MDAGQIFFTKDLPLIQQEELKRLRCADPLMFWEVYQKTVAWLDSQQPIPRASKAVCAQRKSGHGCPSGSDQE